MKTRILIVDDSRTTLGLMEKLVGKIEGCEAVVYDDSVALADAIDSEEFDIAVIDFVRAELHKRPSPRNAIQITNNL